jgi:hypothetical protein
MIEQAMETRPTCADSDSSGEHLETIIRPTPIDSSQDTSGNFCR